MEPTNANLPPTSPPTWRTLLRRGLTAAGIAVLVLPLFGTLGRFHWIPDLFTNFRVQYLVALLIIAVLLAALRNFKPAVAMLACSALLAIEPLGFFLRPATPEHLEPAIKLISHNVRTRTTQHDKVSRFLHDEFADVVFLMEINQRWVDGLSGLFDEYPHCIALPRDDNFGVLLLSRWPIESHTIHYLGKAGVPTIEATIVVQDLRVHFFGTHPVPPSGRENSANRNAQLHALVSLIEAITNDCVIAAGDFNLTPYSSHYCDFLKSGGLINSAQGFGARATWRRNFFPFAIPIDHVFHSPSLHTVERRIGPRLGSDHSALVVSLAPKP